MRCPSPELIQSYLNGDVAVAQNSDLELHFDGCKSCLAKLAHLSSDTPLPEDTAAREIWTEDLADRLADGVRRTQKSTSVTEFALPFYVGDFELLEELGRGGMGTVYRARQLKLNRTVAVKMIVRHFLKESIVDRFHAEARAAGLLDHPGIVPVYDVGEFGPYVFFAMAYVPGGTLDDDRVDRPRTPHAVAALVRDIAAAVQFAHERGVIHRDLKPSNILLDADGRPKVADFGLAKQIDSGADLTASGEVLGTPGFMAPEQAGGAGSVTTASDVYGLGTILFHQLTGRAPFVGDDAMAVLYQVVNSEPPAVRSLCPAVPIDLQTIVRKCLAKSPPDRYASAAEVERELERFLKNEPIAARPPNRPERILRWCRRHPALAAVSTAAVLAVTFGTLFSLYYGLLANDRANRLTTMNQELKLAEISARRAAHRAETQAAIATAEANATLQTLELMVYDVQAIVTNNPAEQKRRRELLQSSLSRLEAVSPDFVDAARLARCRANIILGLAEVTMQLGDDSGRTGLEASRPLFLKSIAELRQLVELAPDDDDAAADLASALREFADLLADAGQWRDACDFFFEVLPISERLARQSPSDPIRQGSLAEAEIFCAESLMNLGQLDDAGELITRARDRCLRTLEDVPDHLFVRGELVHALMELGDWHRARRDFEGAEAAFTQMQTHVTALVERSPGDTNALMDLSTAWERLGDISGIRGDHQQALDRYIQSMQIAERAGRTAPDNDQVQWDVTFGYQKVADGYERLGQYSQVRQYAEKCVAIRSRLAEADPGNRRIHVKLFHALHTLTRACNREQDHAAALHCLAQMKHFASAFNAHTGTQQFAAIIEECDQKTHTIVAERESRHFKNQLLEP